MNKVEWNKEKIAKAARDFNKWQGAAVIMVDTSDGDVWTDVFMDDNTYRIYHSNSIYGLFAKNGFYHWDWVINAETIDELLAVEAYKYKNIYTMPKEVFDAYFRAEEYSECGQFEKEPWPERN